MQYVENDMDELFRKAAQNYPLKTDSADWSAVEKGLREQSIVVPIDNRKNKKYRRFFWLLLLLPLPFLCNRYMNTGEKQKTEAITGKPEEAAIANNKGKKPVASEKEKANNNHLKLNNSITASRENASAKSKLSLKTFNKKNADDDGLLMNNAPAELNKSNQPPLQQHQALQQTKANPQLKEDVAKNNAKLETAFNKSIEILQKKLPDTAALLNVTATKDSAALTVSNLLATKPVQTKIKTAPPVKKGLYAGVIAGPDVSTIKFQSIKKTGYTVGVLLGYRFNKKISLETGFLWDKKNYYTEGKYFNKQRTGIPDEVVIKNMDGSCNMIELPINFRYDIASRTNKRFFATAGLTSYFMKKEDYDYYALANGSWYSGSHSYKNSTTNLLGVANLSAGYEVRLSNIGTFRIEPYLKIPLKGIGIGSLPILSGGVYFGITRTIK